MKYSIIIPVLNNEKLTRACIESVIKNTDDFELIIVDNGSKIPYKGPGIVIRNEKNLGFPVAINQGILKSIGDIVVFLNNDTVVSFGWLDRLSAHLVNYDMVGPLCNSISGPQHILLGESNLPERLYAIAEDIYKSNMGVSSPFARLVFFCVAIKRSVIDKIGLLDEQFTPGNCEDDDYCLRAIDAGFKLGIAQDVLIYHAGSSTFKNSDVDYRLLLQTNMKKLTSKFPEDKYKMLVQKNIGLCNDILNVQKKSLALCMVVKNEGIGLERAILSVKDYVSEIVIAVDNSSVDQTLEIAKKYATTLKTFDWKDDFAYARNFAHTGVKSDWIFFLDGHEYVTKFENIRQMLLSPADGLLCTVELENGAQIRNPRIYRNGFQFKGAVHEIQNCRSLSVYPGCVVKHARLGGQATGAIKIRDVQRDDQLNRIMGRQIEVNPSDVRALFHLALHKQAIGDFKGALKLQKRYLQYGVAHGERWYVFFNRALCYLALKNYLRCLWTCHDAEKETAGRWEIAKLRGLVYFKNKNYKRAIKYFVDSFDDNLGDVSFKPWVREDSEVWNLIGECYFQLNLYDLAKDSFKEAWKFEKDGVNKKLYYDRFQIMKRLS